MNSQNIFIGYSYKIIITTELFIGLINIMGFDRLCKALILATFVAWQKESTGLKKFWLLKE